MSDDEHKDMVKEESQEEEAKPVDNKSEKEQDVKSNQKSEDDEPALKEDRKAGKSVKDELAIPANDEDDEDEEEVAPRTKKRKVASAPDPDYDEVSEELVNENGEHYIELSNKRRATVREFKGSTLIDLREYYTDKSGDEKPGSKGMSLTTEQWSRLKASIPQIDAWIGAGSGSGSKNGDSSKNKSTRGKRKASGRS
ncbi:hypothetical protein QFC22_005080 [Naganishia vaughanmartiniae]|uniref:Uncharacterized protein n=1 Tax=Naganishia vaughanmartiniae TaxID=1424756 RepID=A0ACC2WZJ1_9TREE|nr:hypothetical protein QFC22_005080 [Naganishia vaughanmartiniae]